MKRLILIFLTISTFLFAEYSYPYKDRQVATVLGSSTLMTEGVSEEVLKHISNYKIDINGDYQVPKPLWFEEGFKFSLASQSKPSPLIFLIAGTGSAYDSTRMKYFQRIFFDAGYHVMSVTSPVHINFIVNASTVKMPGRLENDSEDIYNVMKIMYDQVKHNIDVTEFHLMGYSLGAAQAAFVSRIDEKEKAFDFKRVFMINPVVDLLTSAKRLDRELNDYNEKNNTNVGKTLEEVFREIVKLGVFQGGKITETAIYSLFKSKIVSPERLAAIVGLSFRVISVDLQFATDLIHGRGVIIPKEEVDKLTETSSFFPYFEKINFAGFENYFNNIAAPFFNGYGLSTERILKESNLSSIEEYLRNSKKIVMVTNADEIIIDKNEINYLKNIFKERAIVYPYGGHCGNMFYTPNVNTMLRFFKTGVFSYEE